MYSKRWGGLVWGSTPTRNCTPVPSSWTRKAEPHGAYGHQPNVSAPGPGCCCTFPWLTLGTFLPSSLLCCENESECWLTEEALVAPLTEGHRNCFGVRDLSGFSRKSWLRGSLDQSFSTWNWLRTWTWSSCVVKGWPGHGGMLTCILGLYPPDAKSTAHSWLIHWPSKMSADIVSPLQGETVEQKDPVRTTALLWSFQVQGPELPDWAP